MWYAGWGGSLSSQVSSTAAPPVLPRSPRAASRTNQHQNTQTKGEKLMALSRMTKSCRSAQAPGTDLLWKSVLSEPEWATQHHHPTATKKIVKTYITPPSAPWTRHVAYDGKLVHCYLFISVHNNKEITHCLDIHTVLRKTWTRWPSQLRRRGTIRIEVRGLNFWIYPVFHFASTTTPPNRISLTKEFKIKDFTTWHTFHILLNLAQCKKHMAPLGKEQTILKFTFHIEQIHEWVKFHPARKMLLSEILPLSLIHISEPTRPY